MKQSKKTHGRTDRLSNMGLRDLKAHLKFSENLLPVVLLLLLLLGFNCCYISPHHCYISEPGPSPPGGATNRNIGDE